MANEVSIFADGSALPAHLTGVQDAITNSLASGTGGSGKRISIKGSVFRMMVEGKEVAVNEERAMNVVVVAAAATNNRQYYKGTYQDGVATAPDCYSTDSRTPAADSKDRQSSSCATCPQNIKGSGQGESRACRYQRRLAVVLEGDLGGEVYQVALPATSIFGAGESGKKLPLQAYADYLKLNNCAVTAVVTEMRFDTSVATPKLTFRAVRPLSPDEYEICVGQGQSADAKRAVELTVSQTDGVPATGSVKTQPAQIAKAEPVGDDPAEPTKVTSAKAAKTIAERPDMASVLAEFGND
jgi:hypothetical protein